MSISKKVNMIGVDDWDNLVQKTYGKPYSFQQQNGCVGRGIINITIPEKDCKNMDDDMHDSIPEVVNGEKMGVKFKVWLDRKSIDSVDSSCGEQSTDDWMISLFWERNFYPDINVVANDLYEKGLIEAGDYKIEIDW